MVLTNDFIKTVCEKAGNTNEEFIKGAIFGVTLATPTIMVALAQALSDDNITNSDDLYQAIAEYVFDVMRDKTDVAETVSGILESFADGEE